MTLTITEQLLILIKSSLCYNSCHSLSTLPISVLKRIIQNITCLFKHTKGLCLTPMQQHNHDNKFILITIFDHAYSLIILKTEI